MDGNTHQSGTTCSVPGCGRRAVLAKFVRQECACYNHRENMCLHSETACNVLCGKPCKYFESSVLGRPGYPYPISGYDYDKLHAAYQQISYRMAAENNTVRRCLCGKPLPKRRRYCDNCRLKRQRKRQREYQFARRRKAS